MKYKRYGEANMRVLMKWYDKFCKEFNIHDKHDLLSRIVRTELQYDAEDVTDELGVEKTVTEAFNRMSDKQKDYVRQFDEYQFDYVNRMFAEIKTEMTMPILYVNEKTHMRLWNSMEMFDYDMWSGFNNTIAMELTMTDMMRGEGLMRIRAESMKHIKYVLFHFDAWTESSETRKATRADKDGFYQYGVILYNKQTRRFYVNHVGDSLYRNTLNLRVSKDCSIKVEKMDNADMEYLFNIVLNHEQTATTVCANLKHLLVLQKAYKEYMEAQKDISEIQSKSALTRRTKKHEARGEQVEVSIADGDINVVDRLVTLSEYMKKVVPEKKEWQGGHHNSPVPHQRAGHWSRSKLGKVFWVNETYVQSPKHKDLTVQSKAVKLK